MKKIFIFLMLLFSVYAEAQNQHNAPYFYRVTNFGVTYAMNGGGTDITPYVKKACDTAYAHGGGVVLIPAGVWGWSKLNLTGYTNVSLWGESKVGTILSGMTADTMITYDNNQFFTHPVTNIGNAPGYGYSSLENFTLEGHNVSLMGINYQYGYWFYHKGIVIDSMLSTGLNLRGTLTGVFDDFLVKWCPIGVTGDTINLSPGGNVAPNLMTFRNLKVYNCPTWGMQISNSGGAIQCDNCDISDEGTLHNPNTGGIRLNKPSSTGASLLLANCWFEHNLGTLVRTDNEATLYVTLLNCLIANTLTPSYGVYMSTGSGSAVGSYLNIIGTNIASDSVDLHVSGFLQINLLGSSYGTSDAPAGTAYEYIHDLDKYGIAYPLGLSGPAFVSSTGPGAGTSPTVTLSSQSNSYTGDITITPGTSPSASSVVCTIGWNRAWAATGISPTITPGNAAAAALSGTAAMWSSDAGSTTHYLQINVGSTPLGTGPYVIHYSIGGQ